MKKIVVLISLVAILCIGCNNKHITDEGELLPPSNLVLVQNDNETIQLTWQDNSTSEEYFFIGRKINENEWNERYMILPENTTSFIDSNLDSFGLYIYRITAGFSQSEYTEYVQSEIEFALIDSFAAPTNLVLEQLDAYSIQLSWQDNSIVEDGFRIDRKIGENDWDVNYQSIPANSLSFVDGNLDTIETYSYRVQAYLDMEETDFTEASIDFSYNDVSYINPVNNGPVVVNGYYPTEYRVALTDENGSIIDRECDVWYKFLHMPEGVNINQELFTTTDSISVMSVNGYSSIDLYSGVASGTVHLKIFVYNFENEEISINVNNIIASTGPPDSVILSNDGLNEATNAGAGFWTIEVAALLSDYNGNPVDYGTAVYFSLPNDEDWAYISTDATYCGNENTDGDSLQGVANTTLTYSGSYTNENLSVQVQSGEFVEAVDIILPLQFPEVHVDLVPETLFWCQNDEEDDDDKSCQIYVYVNDGQDNPISNQRVEFNIGLGTPSTTQGDNQGEYFGITNENGYIEKYWDFQMFQVPTCVPPSWSSTITTEIVAEILEAGGVDQATMTLIRYCDCSTNE
jgi:hypothetical protein